MFFFRSSSYFHFSLPCYYCFSHIAINRSMAFHSFCSFIRLDSTIKTKLKIEKQVFFQFTLCLPNVVRIAWRNCDWKKYSASTRAAESEISHSTTPPSSFHYYLYFIFFQIFVFNFCRHSNRGVFAFLQVPSNRQKVESFQCTQ